MMKMAPSSCPPVQHRVLPTSGEKGYVISTRYSSVTGRRLNDDAPSNAATANVGAMLPVEVDGAKMNPMYEAATTGTRALIVPR